MMDLSGALISWANEAVARIPASLYDPMNLGAIFAVIVLAILYSMVSSLKRLNRRVASFSSELTAIRTTLRKMEWSLAMIEGKGRPGDKEGKDIGDLLFRVDDGAQS